MKILKRLLWMVAGLVVGAAGGLTAQSRGILQKPVPRLQVTAAGSVMNNDAFFIRDSKSGACWLALRWTSAEMTLAAAPNEACD